MKKYINRLLKSIIKSFEKISKGEMEKYLNLLFNDN